MTDEAGLSLGDLGPTLPERDQVVTAVRPGL
jgi:hypothetical protein